MKAYQIYQSHVQEKLQMAFSQSQEIETAALWISETLKDEGWIYTSGTGHSHMMAEEIFYRAGGYARIRPIFNSGLMLHVSAMTSTELERAPGYGLEVIQEYPISSKDVFLISSNSGRNSASIEMAQFAKDKGAKIIVITNLKHSQAVYSRHPSGQKLYEIADLYLDNFGEIGDACVDFENFEIKVSPTSTAVGAALLQAIMAQVTENLLESGIRPEVFHSSNSDEGEQHNELILAKYKPLVNIL